MSRINLEDPQIRRPREMSPQYGITTIVLQGALRIPIDGPTIYFLDCNQAHRSVFLPEFAPFGGQMYYVSNAGEAGNVDLYDTNGTLQAIVEPGHNAVCWSSTNKWWFLVGGTGGIVVGAATQPPEILGAGLLADPIRFGGVVSDPEFFVGKGTVAEPLTLSASGGVIVSDNPPNTRQGRLWYESDTGIFWLWYEDGTSGQWVQMNGSGSGGGGGPPSGDYQPLDAELTAIAGLVSAADKLPYFTGLGSAALTNLTSTGRTLISQANMGDVLTVAGAQPLDAELSAIAGLVSAADTMPYFTGSGTAALTPVSPFMRTVLDDVDAATVRNSIVAQAADGDLTALSNLSGTNTIYYRSGIDTWSPVAFSGLTFSGGVLTATASGGNVSNSGTPVAAQYAKWTDATHIQGVNGATVLADIGAQPLDADLTQLAALTGTDTLYCRTGTGWQAVTYAGGLSFAGGVLTGSGGGGGNVSNSGTPNTGELAEWVTATTIKGITKASLGYAPLASPALTGTPTAPTAIPATNSTQIATTAYVTTAVGTLQSTIVGGAPATMDTLGEISTYITGTVEPSIAAKAPLASPVFTGNPTAPTPTAGDNDTSIATTAFVTNAVAGKQPLDGDLTALAAASGTNTIYYRSAADTWSAVTFSGLTFSGGVLSVSVGGGNVSNSGTPNVGELAEWVSTTAIKGITKTSLGFAPIANPTFTGVPSAPTASPGTNTTQLATTAFVQAAGFAPLADPTFTGNPSAPTPATADNDTSIATTAFVKAQGYATTGALNGYLPLTGGTLTGSLTVDMAAPSVVFAKAAGSAASITAKNKATGNNRWVVNLADGAAESGSNAGSDFVISRYADDGTYLDAPVVIGRSSGATSILYAVLGANSTGTTQAAADNSTKLATTAFVKTGLGSYLPLAGGTLTGDLTIDKTNPTFKLIKASANQISINGYQGTGGPTGLRWSIIPGAGETETGGNVGSNFYIGRYSDSGALIDYPFFIDRQTGLVKASVKPPTRTVIVGPTSGTYGVPAGARWIEVEICGGGGGGQNGLNTVGGNGGPSNFGGILFGNAGDGAGGGAPASGGDLNIPGGFSGSYSNTADGATYGAGAPGGGSHLGNPGVGNYGGAGTNAQGYGAGGGGGGRSAPTQALSGNGGGGGGYVKKLIANPAASYSYTVGGGGAGAAASGNGMAGGNGAPGILIVTEHYV